MFCAGAFGPGQAHSNNTQEVAGVTSKFKMYSACHKSRTKIHPEAEGLDLIEFHPSNLVQ